MSSRLKLYVCIGGPLNGQHAGSEDFRQGRTYPPGTSLHDVPPGLHAALRDEYSLWNRNSRFTRWGTTAVWLHRSVVQPSVPPTY